MSACEERRRMTRFEVRTSAVRQRQPSHGGVLEVNRIILHTYCERFVRSVLLFVGPVNVTQTALPWIWNARLCSRGQCQIRWCAIVRANIYFVHFNQNRVVLLIVIIDGVHLTFYSNLTFEIILFATLQFKKEILLLQETTK